MAAAAPPAVALQRTPLHELHVSLGARMVAFAGYEMPVQYPPGILKEHLHTRAHAGLFDVSHMGQAFLVETCRLQRYMKQCRVAQSQWPPRDEEWI